MLGGNHYNKVINKYSDWSRNNCYLLHGTNCAGLKCIVPHQANCNSHRNGNLYAVYATDDIHLAIYYAILDRKKWVGVSKAQKLRHQEEYKYKFALEGNVLDAIPFCKGYIYSLDREGFFPVCSNGDISISEWYSLKECIPMLTIEVYPEDFKFLNTIDRL